MNDAAMRDGTEGTAAADAAAEKEATTAAEEEARWAEPQPEEWREAAAGKRWRSRNAATDGRVRVAIQAVGPWASVKELFRAIEKQQTRPIAWIFMSKRGKESPKRSRSGGSLRGVGRVLSWVGLNL